MKTNFDISNIAAIATAKEAYEKQIDIVKDAEYIRDVLKANYISKVRECKSLWDYRAERLDKAFDEQNEKYKKNRENYEYIKAETEDVFFNGNKLDKIKIIQGGYSTYCYHIYTHYHGIHIDIVIPMRNIIDIDNFEYAYKGKFALLYEKSNSYWELLIDSYNEEDIAEFLKNFTLENLECVKS